MRNNDERYGDSDALAATVWTQGDPLACQKSADSASCQTRQDPPRNQLVLRFVGVQEAGIAVEDSEISKHVVQLPSPPANVRLGHPHSSKHSLALSILKIPFTGIIDRTYSPSDFCLVLPRPDSTIQWAIK